MKIEDIGAWVYAARTKRGWSQGKLASMAGLNQPTISELENMGRGARSHGDAKLSTLIKIGDALGYPFLIQIDTETMVLRGRLTIEVALRQQELHELRQHRGSKFTQCAEEACSSTTLSIYGDLAWVQ